MDICRRNWWRRLPLPWGPAVLKHWRQKSSRIKTILSDQRRLRKIISSRVAFAFLMCLGIAAVIFITIRAVYAMHDFHCRSAITYKTSSRLKVKQLVLNLKSVKAEVTKTGRLKNLSVNTVMNIVTYCTSQKRVQSDLLNDSVKFEDTKLTLCFQRILEQLQMIHDRGEGLSLFDIRNNLSIYRASRKNWMLWHLGRLPGREPNWFTELPVVYNPQFSYTLNNEPLCAQSETETLFIVATKASNVLRRQEIRVSELGRFVKNLQNKAKLVFYVGNDEQLVYTSLRLEHHEFSDIIHENFTDDFKYQTRKFMGILRWVKTYCPQAKFVFKVEDHVDIVNPDTLITSMKEYLTRYSNFMVGADLQTNKLPHRNEDSEFFISHSEYNHYIFPPTLVGTVLGFCSTTVELLNYAMLHVRPILLADVYVMGMCSAVINSKLIADTRFQAEVEEEI